MAIRVSIIQSNASSTAATRPGFRDYEFQRFEKEFLEGGIIEGVGDEFEVTQNDTPNMTVNIGAGLALLEITNTNVTHGRTYKVYVESTAEENRPVDAADGTHPRKDRVVLYVDVSTNPNTASSNVGIIDVLPGTPDASPTAPAEPANAITLAIIDIPASDTTIGTAQITDSRTDWVKMKAGVLKNVLKPGLLNNTAIASGTGDVIVATYDPPVTALVDGAIYFLHLTAANTGPVTINPNGLGAIALKKYENQALEANDLKADNTLIYSYDASDADFKMLSVLGNAPASSQFEVLDKTADYTIVVGDVGKAITNNGATAGITFTLPQAAAGLNYTISVVSGGFLKVNPDGDNIRAGIENITTLRSNAPGSTIELYAPNASSWFIRAMTGFWNRSSTEKGYWLGGSTGSVINTIAALLFSTQARTNLTATLQTTRGWITGVSGSGKGYGMGGNTGSASAVISTLNFATEAEGNLSETLNTARGRGAGTWSITKGYAMGGEGASNKIDDMTFATEVSAELVATIGAARSHPAGGSSNTKGYALGGDDGSVSQDDIYALTFAAETTATLGALISANRTRLTGVSASAKCYTMGGSSAGGSGPVNIINALTFSGETIATPAATLDTGRANLSGIMSSEKGFAGGGFDMTSTRYNKIDDLNFSTEASAEISTTLSAATDTMGGVQTGV